MEFKKYTSIENSYRQKEVDSIKLYHNDVQYYVQEKVHGSNFGLYCDGENVKSAKRSGFVKDDERFFNYEDVESKYKEKVFKLFSILYERDSAEEIVVFGELYGGIYPHPEVEKCQQSTVQKGVYYAPHQDFIAFDIKVNGHYLPKADFEALCKVVDIPYLPALFVGTFDECCAYSNEFQTTIPAMHNLPEIEKNMCEGVIIRPIEVRYHGNGQRVILKNKNNNFREINGDLKKRTPKQPIELPKHVEEMAENILAYITENRLRNVISHVGTITPKQFGMLLGAFCKDIFDDFSKDFVRFDEIETKERKAVMRIVNKEAGNLIRENIQNIFDGNF